MQLIKINWYLYRISKINLSEVFYRFFYLIKMMILKFEYNLLRLKSSDSKYSIDLEKIFSLELPSQNILKTEFNFELKKIKEESDRALKNDIKIFNKRISFSEGIDWHLDPRSKKRWSSFFFSNINFRDIDYLSGPKLTWEMNRLYFLPSLGIAFYITSKKKYADKIFGILEDWLKNNPYPFGINWTSAIELSIRIFNLMWALAFLKKYELSRKQKKMVNNFIFLHANYINNFPSKFSSCNNHAIAEAFGLFVSGVFSKKSFRTRRWVRRGQKILNTEIKKQIFDDGGSIECSVTYLSFVYDFFLIYKILCDRENLQYPEIVNERLRKSAIFIDEIIDVGGNLPNIGDQDSAVAINFGLSNWENFKSILNTASFLFKDLQIKNISQTDIKTYLLTRNSHIKKKKRENSGINFESILFKESGLVVIKDSSKDKEIIFYGNCSPMGMPPLYAHGHLDALSFMLSINGDEIFIDPGTYLYHSGGKWRKYFRSSAAHNTVRINKTDFSTQPGDFMYGRPYKIKYIDFIDNNNETKWISEHDAYRGEPVKGSHKRIFSYLKKSREFEVTDIIYSAIPNYKVELFFHLHPECSIDIFNNNIHIMRNKNIVILSVDDKLKIKVFNGSEDPIFGWYSKNFNEIERTNTIVCSGFFNGSIKIVNRGSIK